MFVTISTAAQRPAMMLSQAMTFMWRNEKGLPCTDRVMTGGFDGKTMAELADSRDAEDQETYQQYKPDLESECQIVEKFLEGRESRQLPELDVKDAPFWGMYLYWKSPASAVRDKLSIDSI